jgi:hypothetical protein
MLSFLLQPVGVRYLVEGGWHKPLLADQLLVIQLSIRATKLRMTLRRHLTR